MAESGRSHSRISVLAGTNGAGKSSIAGRMLVQAGGQYFNPDDAAVRFREQEPGLSQQEANALAWQHGVRLLTAAIDDRVDYTFETTLGGETITAMLEDAMTVGIDVLVWYVGLATPEMHIERVRSRAARGGHDIPEERIRYRYERSRLNVIRLMPKLAELSVFDNSQEADPSAGKMPQPLPVLHMVKGEIVEVCDLRRVPGWAKPIVAAAVRTR